MKGRKEEFQIVKCDARSSHLKNRKTCLDNIAIVSQGQNWGQKLGHRLGPNSGPKLLSYLWQLLFSKLRRHLWFAGDLLPNWPFGLGSAEVHLLSGRPRQRPLGRRKRKLRPRLDFDDRYLRTLGQKGQVDYRMIGNSERKKTYSLKFGEILVAFSGHIIM